MSVTEREIKIIKLSGRRYDLLKQLKKVNEQKQQTLKIEIEKINKEIEVLLNDAKK